MSSNTLNKSGLLAAFTFSIAWATTGATVKLLPPVSALALSGFRCLFALLGFSVFILCSRHRHFFSIWSIIRHTKSWPLIGIMTLNFFTIIYSYQLAPVAEIVLINGCAPVFVMIYNRIKGFSLPHNQALGAFSALLGLGIIVLPALGRQSLHYPHYTTGIMVGTISSLTVAAYAIIYRNLELRKEAPKQINLTWLIFLTGAIVYGTLSLLNAELPSILGTIQYRSFGLLLSLGIVSTAIPTIAYSQASRLLPPIITTSFRLLTPLTAILLAYLLVGEIPSGLVIPGGILIIIGLLLMVLRRP
jgi:drug/metabolite transporter (DMT)-like permease